jgi:hypothetical protein
VKRILLAGAITALALQGQGVQAQAAPRDYPYPIKAGLSAVVKISGGDAQRATVRVGNGPEQQLGSFDDEEVDQMASVDIDHDGYRDLVLGQSGGGTQLITRLFLYRPATGTFQEIQHPDKTSPCRGFVNPVFDDKQARISVGCRYGAASNGAEEYVLRPDGTVHATSWSTQALFGLDDAAAELTYHFREDSSTARIDIEGEGSPLEDGTVPVSKLDLYDTPDLNAKPAMTAAEGEHLDVVAIRPRDWLQVRYASKTAGDVLKWVRYGDLRVDKHQLPAHPPQGGLELELADTLGDWNGEDGGIFLLSVANRGEAPAQLKAPRVWLLLTNAQGDRIVHPLYQREGDTLHPANPLGFARDAVVWGPDADGKPAYMVNDNGYGSVPFLPALAPGKYRAAAVVTDPGNLAHPLVSNEIGFDYPLPKRPPAPQ